MRQVVYIYIWQWVGGRKKAATRMMRVDGIIAQAGCLANDYVCVCESGGIMCIYGDVGLLCEAVCMCILEATCRTWLLYTSATYVHAR